MSRGESDSNRGGGRYTGHGAPGTGLSMTRQCWYCRKSVLSTGGTAKRRGALTLFRCAACVALKTAAEASA